MGDEDQRGGPALLLGEDQVDDGRAGFGVQIAGRFVGREDERIGREGAGERHPLLLAARELRRIVEKPGAEADGPELRLGPREGVGLPRELQRHGDVFERRHGRNKLERLEHHAYFFPTEASERVLGHRAEVAAVDPDDAPVGALQSGEGHEERGFARPGRPQQTDRLAGGYLQAHAFENMDPRGAVAQGEVDIREFDDRLQGESFLNVSRPQTLLSPYRLFGLCLQIAAVALLLAASLRAEAAPRRILAFGDSLTAGPGLSAEDTFPAQLQRRLTADGFDVEVINAGVSGDTTEMGLARLDYALSAGPVDVAILELGANDMLNGMPPANARANLAKMIEAFQAKGVAVVLAAMVSSNNWGQAYREEFDSIYPDLAKKYGVTLAPSFMEGVWNEPKHLLGDGVHPNAAGVARIVKRIAPHVEKLLSSSGVRKASRPQ